MSRTLISRRRPAAARRNKAAARTQPAPRRHEAEALLRDAAFALHLTRSIRERILRDRAAEA
jgi:hypothetical protein